MDKIGLTYPEKIVLQQYIDTTFKPYRQDDYRRLKRQVSELKKYPLTHHNYADRLAIENFLGSGKDGFTYLMKDRLTQAVVVVKFTLSSRREFVVIDTLRSLKKEGLFFPFPDIYDYFEIVIKDQTFGVLIEEYIVGPTLFKWLQGPVALDDLYQIISQMLQGLDLLTRTHILHTDLVFSNMIWDVEAKRLFFIDFGSACFRHSKTSFACPAAISSLEDLTYIVELWKKYLVDIRFAPIWKVLQNLLQRAQAQPEKLSRELVRAIAKLEQLRTSK